MYSMNNTAKKIFLIATTFLIILSLGITVSGIDETALNQTKEKLQSAKNDFESAETNYKNALSEKETIDNQISQEKKLLSELENKNFDTEIIANYSKWQNSLKTIPEKEQNYTEWKSKADESLVEYNKGSFGFFEYVGADDALDALQNSKYVSYTHQGDENDATNLDNMKSSFDFIRKCNELRTAENTDPQTNKPLGILKVTDYLMAAAQANANYSLINTNHSEQFEIGENIAWGYNDPFPAWYDDEKNAYLSGNSDFEKIGHYINIVNAEYFTTGFAVAKGGSYSIEQVQTFFWEAENSMTVDEYETRFMEYYNKVTKEYNKIKPSLEKANSELETARSDTAQYEKDYNQSVDNKSKNESEISEKKSQIASLEKSASETETKVSALKKTRDEKQKNYNSLQNEYDSMKLRFEREQSALSKEENSGTKVSSPSPDRLEDEFSKINSSETSSKNTLNVFNEKSSTKDDTSQTASTESAQRAENSDYAEDSVNWSAISEQSENNIVGIIVAAVFFMIVAALSIIFLRRP